MNKLNQNKIIKMMNNNNNKLKKINYKKNKIYNNKIYKTKCSNKLMKIKIKSYNQIYKRVFKVLIIKIIIPN